MRTDARLLGRVREGENPAGDAPPFQLGEVGDVDAEILA